MNTMIDKAAIGRRPASIEYSRRPDGFRVTGVWANEAGFSAVETTVILIAFVTLSAIFAYAVLTTGVLASEQSRGAIVSGLREASATMNIRGAAVGEANDTTTALERISFQVQVIARGTDGVYLAKERTIISYLDVDQIVRFDTDDWTATWLTGFGPLVNPGELVEIGIDLSRLDPPLGPSKKFKITVGPDQGATLSIERSTPAELDEFVDLP